MLTFLQVLLTIVMVVVLVIQLGGFGRLALAIRRSPRLRRLLPDWALLFAFRLTPVGGGMGNLLLGGSSLYSGSGVPTDANLGGAPANGDYYFRTDTPATVTQRIYVRSAGAWIATAT